MLSGGESNETLGLVLGILFGFFCVCCTLFVIAAAIAITACVVISQKRNRIQKGRVRRKSTEPSLSKRDSLSSTAFPTPRGGDSSRRAHAGGVKKILVKKVSKFKLFGGGGVDRRKDSAISVIGSSVDDDGIELPSGWTRHVDATEQFPYYTKGDRSTWTRPQLAQASAMVTGASPRTDWKSVRSNARASTWSAANGEWATYRDSSTGQQFWSEKTTGRSTWTSPAAVEYRIAAEDGFAYNKEEFLGHYGGTKEWNRSKPLRPTRSAFHRFAGDGMNTISEVHEANPLQKKKTAYF
jgi:hypothetical protein